MENLASNDQITRKDLLDLEERLTNKLVSKEELKEVVSKLATKEDLKNETSKLATRETVEVLAIQVLKNTTDIDEIKTELKSVNNKIFSLHDKIDRIDEKFESKFNMILNAVDNVLKEVTNNRVEKTAIDHALVRQDDRLDNHEKRIRKLELESV